MPITKPLSLRGLTPDERQALEQLASSRTAQARLVERAKILLALAEGRGATEVAHDLGVSRPTVYTRIHRFNDRGLAGLGDRPRSGRPRTYSADRRAEVIAAALTDPKELGLPFGCWTLDRLRDYLNEQKGIPIKRSRIGEILVDEGLRWRHQETWFGERDDPDFAEKRGSSNSSTPRLRRGASSSASTRWGRSRPRATPAKNPSTPSPDRAAMAKPGRPSGPSKRSTTAAAARGTSSAPSARRPARR
jgi:transposase